MIIALSIVSVLDVSAVTSVSGCFLSQLGHPLESRLICTTSAAFSKNYSNTFLSLYPSSLSHSHSLCHPTLPSAVSIRHRPSPLTSLSIFHPLDGSGACNQCALSVDLSFVLSSRTIPFRLLRQSEKAQFNYLRLIDLKTSA